MSLEKRYTFIPVSKASEQHLLTEGQALYRSSGVEACIAFAAANGITATAYCEFCQAMRPVIDNGTTCFVCESEIIDLTSAPKSQLNDLL